MKLLVIGVLVAFALLSIAPSQSEIIIPPLFQTTYRLQFYAVVVPYLVREYQRRSHVQTPSIRYLKETDPDIEANLTGKTAIITGGSRGLGVEVVKTFLRKGCRVITTTSSKNAKEIEKRYAKITADLQPGPWKLEIWYIDLMKLDTVKAFADRFTQGNHTGLHYFIANAGLMFPSFRLSENGFESQFSINYLGHTLLAFHFLPHLRQTAKKSGRQSRMVLVSSCLHHIPTRIRWNDLQAQQVYSPEYSYGVSKVAIVMLVRKLSRVLKSKPDWGKHVKVFSVHPGLVDTDLLNTIEIMKAYPLLANQIALRSTKAGAETIIYGALSKELDYRNGDYLEDSRIAVPSQLALNEDDQTMMWDVTKQYLKPWTKDQWFEDL